LVVATFGRGFYVLDNYSSLRSLSDEINKKEAHLFDINEALLYFPASNLNYQGDVHFRTPNPKPSATFEYYVKNEFESLKKKREKAMKAAEKAGSKFVYPTEKELLAEKEEVKPTLVFTIYDMDGNIMRKLSLPLSKGYNSTSWDLSYLSNRGPKVPPGSYKVAIDKNIDGIFTRLVEPKSFVVKSLPNALGTPNYKANFDFLKGVNDLNAKVVSARGKIESMNTSLKSMQTILANTPVEASVLVTKISNLQKEIDTVAKSINGGFGAKNSVASRLRFALYTTSSAQVDITGGQKEQFEIAKTAYNAQEMNLNDLFNNKLPALEKEFEAVGGVLFNNPPSRRRWNE
jgi:flagellar hook assembly protein FlgD